MNRIFHTLTLSLAVFCVVGLSLPGDAIAEPAAEQRPVTTSGAAEQVLAALYPKLPQTPKPGISNNFNLAGWGGGWGHKPCDGEKHKKKCAQYANRELIGPDFATAAAWGCCSCLMRKSYWRACEKAKKANPKNWIK